VGFGLERVGLVFDDAGGVRAVEVDNRDIRDDGWRWVAGSLGEGPAAYGWVAIWRGEPSAAGVRELEHVDWESFQRSFS